MSDPTAASPNATARAGRLRRAGVALIALLTLGAAGCSAPQQGWGGVSVADSNLAYASAHGKVFYLNPDARQKNLSFPAPGEWQYPAEKDKKVGNFYAPPTVTQQAVYAASTQGKVYALNVQNGEQLWEFPKDSRSLGLLVGAPTFADGMVLAPGGDEIFYGIDAATGAEKWRFKAGNKIWSSPAAAKGVVYFGSLDHKVYAFNVATGEKQWEFPVGGAVPGSPLVADGTVYIGAADRNLYALDAATGAKKWSFAAKNWFWTAPVLNRGVLYAMALDHRLYALDAATGQPKWETPFQAPATVLTQPVVVGDVIVLTAEHGAVVTVDLQTGQQRGSSLASGTVLGSGVASGQKVYVPAVDSALIAIDPAGPSATPFFKPG
ncbi:MAG: PQQ-binding-like beta-propeller repeat protein [Chloroflexi bacterium]|nr:PQQ-binding-like beta-propeller repeat protein [Chloroflexota bacterium]